MMLKYTKAMLLILIMLCSTMTLYQNPINSSESSSKYVPEKEKTYNETINLMSFGSDPWRWRSLPLKHSLEIILEFRQPIFLPNTYLKGYSIPLISNCINIVPPGYPILPVNITVIELPYEAKVISIEITNVTSRVLEENTAISPSPVAFPLMRNMIDHNQVFYSNLKTFDKYPEEIIAYKIMNGIDPHTLERKKFIVIYFYPLQYKSDGTILFTQRATIKVVYYNEEPKFMVSSGNANVDVLVITSEELYEEAMNFARMKNDSGLITIIKTVEWIYENYEGRDKPEKIRNCIKDLVNSLGIKFVVIFGDADQVPVRYAWIPDGAYDYDPAIDGAVVETDLYYADLDYTWDDNNDGLWGDPAHDRIDGVPDVIVGRIPVSNKSEARNYLIKLAEYRPTSDWFNTALLIGTDTFGVGWPEGEYLTEYISRFIWNNFTVTKLYETKGNLTPSSLALELSKGYGYINYGGHGDTHAWIIGLGTIFTTGDVYHITNGYRLPVIFSMACLTGRFGDTDGIGEFFLINPGGGAIAYVGATRLAWGYIGEMVTMGLAGKINVFFTQAFFSELRINLGRVWAEAISKYVMSYPPTMGYYGYYLDWKTAAEFVLLGDPTISLVPLVRSNQTELGETEIYKEKLKIDNTTHHQLGELLVNNSTLLISNATLLITDANIVVINNSKIFVNDSMILGRGEIVVSNSSMIINNSVINIPIKLIDFSELIIIHSTVNWIILPGMDSSIHVSSSSIGLKLVLNATSMSINPEEGFFKDGFTLNGYATTLDTSWVRIGVITINSDVTITEARASYVEVINSTLTAKDSKLYMVSVKEQSNVHIEDSTVGLNIELVGRTGLISNLDTKNYSALLINDQNVTDLPWSLYLENVNVISWSLTCMDASKISIWSSSIAEIILRNSNVTLWHTKINHIYAEGSDIILNFSLVMFSRIAEGILYVSASNISYLSLNRVKAIIDDVLFTKMKLLSSNAFITDIYAMYLSAYNISEVFIENSRIVTLEAFDEAMVNITSSRLALIYARNETLFKLKNVTTTFGLRIFDSACIIAIESFIWPELVFINKELTIKNLLTGFVEKLSIKHEWNITIINSVVLGWDILSYDSILAVHNSTIFWLFAYYESDILVNASNIVILRLTHKSHGKVKNSEITQAIISGFSSLIVTKSRLSFIIGLGMGGIKAREIVFSQAVAFMNSSMEFERVSGGIIAPLDQSNVRISESEFNIWLEIYDVNITEPVSFGSGYYSQLSETQLHIPGVKWKLDVRNSKVTWTLVVVNSTAVVENSQLTLMGGISSNVTIRNTLVVDFLGIYDSKTEIKNVLAANISSMVNTVGEIADSSFGVLTLYKSNIVIRNSRMILAPVFDSGSARLKLEPGYYENATLSTFGEISSDQIYVKLEKSWIIAWDFIVLGNASVTLYDSNLLTVAAFEKANLYVENSLVYGYLEFFDTSNIIVTESIIGRLYLSVMMSHLEINVPQKEIDMLEIISREGRLLLSDCYIYSIYIDALRSEIMIHETPIIGDITAQASEVDIISSKISGILTVSGSTIKIDNSDISKISVRNSEANITNSKIGTMSVGSLSQVFVRESSVGLRLILSNVEANIRDLSPVYAKEAVIIGPTSLILLNATDITKWDFVFLGHSNVSIINSILATVISSDFSVVNINDSEVTSLVARRFTNIRVSGSKIGIDLRTYQEDVKLSLRQGFVVEQEISFNYGIGYSYHITESSINQINITAIASELQLDHTDAYIIIGDYASSITMLYTDALFVLLGHGSNITTYYSQVRFLFPYQTNMIKIRHTKVGLATMYFNYNETIMLKSGEIEHYTIRNDMLNWNIFVENATIYDWRIIAVGASRITVINTGIFMAYADGASLINMVNSTMEGPPVAEMKSEIRVYWSLTVQVIRDFAPLVNVNVTVFDENGTLVDISKTNENGEARFMLPQAVIREDKRINLGHYLVKVKYEWSEATQRIYLWKAMKIRIYLIGPISIAVIILVAGVLVFLVWQIIRSIRRAEKAEQIFP